MLTEDDYFDFLIGVTKNNDMIPHFVRSALTHTALLFLGFRLDEWDFRVLFRSLMSQEGRNLRKKFSHVAVQIDPEEGQMSDPEGARRYLSSYFRDARITLYWGSAETFVARAEAASGGCAAVTATVQVGASTRTSAHARSDPARRSTVVTAKSWSCSTWSLPSGSSCCTRPRAPARPR